MTPEEKVRLIWPQAVAITPRRPKGVWSDDTPMADYLGESWEEVATFDRVVSAAHVAETFVNAPSYPPWTSSPDVNRKLVEQSEAIADGQSMPKNSYDLLKRQYEASVRLTDEKCLRFLERAERAEFELRAARIALARAQHYMQNVGANMDLYPEIEAALTERR